ncbi:MAG: hypothetical protein N3C57_05510 [Aquificaceae bacterium]|nr:hypothetical protein [Aquificaceae bacterium]
MGRRRLKFHLIHPFREKSKIQSVQQAVEELLSNGRLLENVRNSLKDTPDLERLISKVSGGLSTPRDMLLIRTQ